MVYLRPETAQGIYVNYLNVLQSSRQKIPFGIAQIGKAFRNEITPGNFIFRTREFEQMEMQFFVKPGTDDEWFEHWRAIRMAWHEGLGLAPAKLRWHQHGPTSWPTTPRPPTTSSTSSRSAGRRSRGFTTAPTSTSAGTRSSPARSWSTSSRRPTSAISPTSSRPRPGADRVTLTVMADAYREETVEGELRVVMGFQPAIAPIKAAVLPLVKKDGLPELALENSITASASRIRRSTTMVVRSAAAIAARTRSAPRGVSPLTETRSPSGVSPFAIGIA